MAAMVAAGFSSCGNKSAKLESDADSISYALGVVMTQGVVEHLQMEYDLDSTYTKEFLRGVQEVMTAKTKSKKAYAAGANFALMVTGNLDRAEAFFFQDDTLSKLDRDVYVQAFIAAMQNQELELDDEDARELLERKQNDARRAQNEKQYGAYRLECIAFLEDNKNQAGVQTTESGLQYKVNVQGHGVKPAALDTVLVEYKGSLIDGTVFDQTSGSPVSLPLARMIPAWQEGLPMMAVGSSYTFYVPYELGYGETGNRMIKPYSTLIFDVKLVGVSPYVEKSAEE